MSGFTEAELQTLPLRRVLELSQTNVTADAEAGLRYARHAYDRGLNDPLDPTAAGEAAAKATIRAAQADRPLAEIQWWTTASFAALPTAMSGAAREQIATYTNANRAYALRSLQHTLGYTTHTTETKVSGAWATDGFRRGNQLAQAQHSGVWWDPYATMLARHRATHEAVSGHAAQAAVIALSGINRALRSRPESANSPSGIRRHVLFVGKQAISNALVLGLAAARPLDVVPRAKAARQQLAYSWLN